MQAQTAILRIGALSPAAGYPIQLELLGEAAASPVAGPEFLPVTWSCGTVVGEQMAELRRQLLESPEPVSLRTAGRKILEWLSGSQAGRTWHELRRASASTFQTLLDVDDPQLRLLPWEIMRDDTKPLFIDDRKPWARLTHFDVRQTFAPLAPPLRILIIVGSEKEDQPVEAETEIEGILEAAHQSRGMLDIHVERRPTRAELIARTKDYLPHVFHFIGHGVGGRSPGLKIESPSPWVLDVDDLPLVLQSHQPRLAVLNACRTLDASEAAEIGDISTAFCAHGVAACVGMQGSIQGASAALMSQPFYEELAHGESVAVAIARARSAIAAVTKLTHRDWYLPSLHLRARPEQVLQFAEPYERNRDQELKDEPRLQFVQDFADREQLRSQLSRVLQAHETSAANLIAVTGKKSVGKSKLLRWAVQACKTWGWHVSYVDLGEPNRVLDFLSLLRMIRAGFLNVPSDGPARRIDRGGFNEFNHRLNRLDEYLENRLSPLPAGVVDEVDPARTWPQGEVDKARQLVDCFGAGLQTAAGTRPLVVALDQFNSSCVSGDNFNLSLLKRFLGRIQNGDWRPVQAILELRQGDSHDLRLFDLGVKPTEVPEFAKEQFSATLEQYCRRRGIYLNPEAKKQIKGFGELLPATWDARYGFGVAELLDNRRP